MGSASFIVTFLSSALLASAAFAAPKTTLHVPLYVEFISGPGHRPHYEYVPVAKVNPILIQNGQKARVEFVDLTAESDFDFFDERDQLTQALDAAGIKNAQGFGEYYPGNFNTEDAYTCYRGEGHGVLEIVLRNAGSNYSDQYTVLGWKLGSKTFYGESDITSDEESMEWLNENSKLWQNYDPKSDSVLILASIGDGGDDVQESLVPHCK